MIAKESLPTLRRWFSPLDHIFGHTRLPDFDAELEQLSMDPGRSPQRVGNAHLADKLAHLLRYSWSATTMSRLPAPIPLKPARCQRMIVSGCTTPSASHPLLHIT